ncbi:hypothetical protein GCK32_002372 [Trichostrongylus colubriformis]|uniref:Uncharacterized protein n=1 Tax=Trichostrongylus colubriformis TaxID=6319 RepID=A0AAN8FII5_TRICO
MGWFSDDIIADASPVSTAVDASTSWYTLPNSETEIEVNPPLMIGGARVIDSLECLRQLHDAQLRPVEDFGNPNIKLICKGVSKTASEIEEEQYEYSYYSDGPSETNVTMDGFEEEVDGGGIARQEKDIMPENEIAKSTAMES